MTPIEELHNWITDNTFSAIDTDGDHRYVVDRLDLDAKILELPNIEELTLDTILIAKVTTFEIEVGSEYKIGTLSIENGVGLWNNGFESIWFSLDSSSNDYYLNYFDIKQ